MFTGAQFQLKNSSGTVLTTVTVPNTGSFQSWQTVSASATLPAGQQTLRIYTLKANGGWNINWWEILTSGSAGVNAKAIAVTNVNIFSDSQNAVAVFPNPIVDRFSLKINNRQKGQVLLTAVSMSGQVVKQFTLNKASEGLTQWDLSLGNVSKGDYIITILMNGWKGNMKVHKE
jgi:endoglucanase